MWVARPESNHRIGSIHVELHRTNHSACEGYSCAGNSTDTFCTTRALSCRSCGYSCAVLSWKYFLNASTQRPHHGRVLNLQIPILLSDSPMSLSRLRFLFLFLGLLFLSLLLFFSCPRLLGLLRRQFRLFSTIGLLVFPLLLLSCRWIEPNWDAQTSRRRRFCLVIRITQCCWCRVLEARREEAHLETLDLGLYKTDGGRCY
jgi:hypothetical protein